LGKQPGEGPYWLQYDKCCFVTLTKGNFCQPSPLERAIANARKSKRGYSNNIHVVVTWSLHKERNVILTSELSFKIIRGEYNGDLDVLAFPCNISDFQYNPR
jgi:hypothetical protein